MRDIAVLLFFLACVGVTFWRPWLGVIALTIFVYLSPHRYAWGFMVNQPVFLLLFFAVFISFLAKGKDRQPLPGDWRIYVFLALWFWYLITTLDALVPKYAQQKLIDTSKVYLPFLLMLWLINTREKLFYLLAAVAGSIAAVAVKGGIHAIKTGFAHRVYGPPGTQFEENNAFGLATLITIPLIVLLIRQVSDRRIKYALMAIIPLMFASALSSHSRGALVTLGVLVPVLLWHSKRKWLAAPTLAIGVVLAINNLPDHWFERMDTIQTFEEDASAMGRIEAWTDGIRYGLSNPITGSGFDGWIVVTRRDWHSAYVEIFAEHGAVGALLWGSLLFGTILSLTRLPRRTRHVAQMRWVSDYSYMLRASLIAYATGSIFLGLTYWTLLYHLIFISVLVKKFALEELALYESTAAPEPRLSSQPNSTNIPQIRKPRLSSP
jgi:probable O-glycosylation ligase (exosortase A-associated)